MGKVFQREHNDRGAEAVDNIAFSIICSGNWDGHVSYCDPYSSKSLIESDDAYLIDKSNSSTIVIRISEGDYIVFLYTVEWDSYIDKLGCSFRGPDGNDIVRTNCLLPYNSRGINLTVPTERIHLSTGEYTLYCVRHSGWNPMVFVQLAKIASAT